MSTPDPLNEFRALPVLAGLCSWADAERPGHGVDEAVGLLKRFHWTLRRLWTCWISRIACEPLYELKMGFSHHAFLAAEGVSLLRTRVAEMREPPLGLEDCPDPLLDRCLDEVLCATDRLDFTAGIYAVILPDLVAGLRAFVDRANALAEAPTIRALNAILADLETSLAFGRATLASIATDAAPGAVDAAAGDIARFLDAAGGVDGRRPARLPAPAPERASRPFRYDGTPRRDERFRDPFNKGTSPEALLYSDDYPARAKALMLLFKRIREIDVPEMMASILAETPGKPWDFYRDMTRQLWDEARHAMMGQVGFRNLGLDWSRTLIRHTWALELNTLLTPLERHAVLYFIEKGLMPRTGKRFEWEVAQEAGMPLLALFQDYDWADEVLHARIGRDWFVPGFPTQQAASDAGDRAWTSIYTRSDDYVARGLTRHDNWWPGFYRHACEVLGWEYDPRVAAFAEPDYTQRSDLKAVAASG